jgi:hypothetical protein
MSTISPMLNLCRRRFIQNTSFSTPGKLHYSLTSTRGNRTLSESVSSPQWTALRSGIVRRNKHICSSCGYLPPHPQDRSMVIDHTDGNAHCPPCDAIRHGKWESEQKQKIVVGVSTMNQVEIVRKTRKIFDTTGVVPEPQLVDKVVEFDRGFLDILETMLKRPWEFPRKDLKLTDSLKCFFTTDSSSLFKDTKLMYVCFLLFK